MSMRVAILDDYQDAARGLACFARLAAHEVETFRDTLTDIDAIARRLEGFDAVVAIRERTRFSRALIERLPPRLKLISLTGPLSGHVDMAAAGERGITVCQGRGSGASAPELTWALVLAATRHIALEDRRMREGRWQTTIGRVLDGLTLGILGYGRIGAKVAGYGRAFGMKVLVHGREGSRERAARDGHALAGSQAELFERSDVLSIHLSMNDGTRGAVRAGDLARMKPDALLVNTARAGLIEPGALLAALRAGRPGMAALDVFDVEPLPAGDPLLALDRVLLAPHLGYVTRDGYEVLFGDAFDNLLAYAAGRPTNVIAPPGAQGETRA
jgi:D-3-phosphoglycerate dehydrogenase